MFRDAYRQRRCIVPTDGFFEWKAIKGQKAKQPYIIAMKDDAPFGIAGILLRQAVTEMCISSWRALPIGNRSFARDLILARMLSRLSAYGPS